MKQRVLSFFLALIICVGAASQVKASAAAVPNEQQAYQAILAMKAQYPEGMSWTNSNYYGWKGGIYSGGYGCAGFAFLLSDAAFGELPARYVTGFTLADIRVGDILRINNDTHSVIVLEVHDSYVVIAEGNYNSSIHWGRTLSASTVLAADYLMTRYPETIPPATFSDVPAWCADAVSWAVYEEITNGTGNNKFSPDDQCKNCEILTFLWRAAESPEPSYQSPIALTGDEYYADAVHWAYSLGMIGKDFDPNAYCTRRSAITYIWRVVDSRYYPGDSVTFTDIPTNGDVSEIAWAVENGITNGYGDNTFRPDNTCTRGEIVTMLYRAYVSSARLP